MHIYILMLAKFCFSLISYVYIIIMLYIYVLHGAMAMPKR